MSDKVDQGAAVAKDHGIERGPKWKKARKDHLKIEPWCVACRKQRKGLVAKLVSIVRPMQVHHIYPFHVVVKLGRPDLELDQRNLITLCSSGDNHHELLGHLADYQSRNPFVRSHSTGGFHGKTGAEIRTSAEWEKLHVGRPRDLEQMTEVEKVALKAELDRVFP